MNASVARGRAALAFPALTLPQLWALLAVALPVIASLIASISTVDLAYQIRAGQIMIDSQAVLRTDPFTFTVGGSAWLDQQWGAQVVLAGLFDAGGWALLVAARALVVGLIFSFVYLSCRAAGTGPRMCALLTLGSFILASPALNMRPQLLGMLCFALVLWLLAVRHRRPRAIWIVPFVCLAWANLHGSFVLGVAATGAAWLDDVWHRRPAGESFVPLAITGLSLLATVITPFAFETWTYVWDLSLDSRIRRLAVEWQPVSLASPLGLVFVASALIVLGLMVRAMARRRFVVPLLPLPLLVLGAVAARGIAWWAIGIPTAVAAMIAAPPAAGADPVQAQPHLDRRRTAANGAVAVVLVIAGIVALPWWRAGTADGAPVALVSDAPQAPVDALRAATSPGARLFVPQAWGSWLELAVPDRQVFVDSRIELFPEPVWNDYLAVSNGEAAALSILDRWAVTAVVVDPDGQAALERLLASDPRWRTIEDDVSAAVFIRR